MRIVGIWALALLRPLRTSPAASVLVLLVAFLLLARPCQAAESPSGPGPRAQAQTEARKDAPSAPVAAALQTGRQGPRRDTQAMLPVRGVNPNLPLLPYLDYLLDESSSLDIEEAAAPDRAQSYAPLVLEKLPRAEGVMWLRFTLAPLASGEQPTTLLLDMGESIPGAPMLYEPERNDLSGALEWRESSPAQRNVLLLPEAGAEPITCYIRLDGLPGLWFSPLVRTPADAATNWGSLARTAAILALGVVMLLCLLRGLSESGQWRIWTALYVAVALGQAILGMPEGGALRPSLWKAAATLSPGLALMLLPHVGRHLMNTRRLARGIDIQLLLLSLPGAALALLPLVPGWSWLDRWLDLWPAATLLFVPTALGAWIMGLAGARRFLLGCLLPPLFVGAGVFGLDFGIPANLLASAPLWGVALSALLIAGSAAPAGITASETGQAAQDRAVSGQELDEASIISLEHPLDDPNLRLIPGEGIGSGHASGDLVSDTGLAGAEQSVGSEFSARFAQVEARETALRAPLDDLLRQGAALEQCALPPAVRQYATDMLAAARRMAHVLSHTDTDKTGMQEGGEQTDSPATAFDLQRLLREAHSAVAPAAEYAGIGLAWYMPPHLGQLYRGDERALGETLDLLLESAVRATRQGAVHLSARRVPESSDPGNILFTVTDTGTGAPPQERSSLALARAWELAARHGGYLGMEYGPNGATIAFSLHLEPLEDSADELPGNALPHVIIVAEDARQRRELVRMLGDLPCRLSEAASEHEALRRHEADPAVLLLTQGRYALPAAADMVAKFAEIASQAGISGCKILAITLDDSQWNLLADSGFTHALLEPVDSEALRQTVRDVIRAAKFIQPKPQKAPVEKPCRATRENVEQASESCGDNASEEVVADAAGEKRTPMASEETGGELSCSRPDAEAVAQTPQEINAEDAGQENSVSGDIKQAKEEAAESGASLSLEQVFEVQDAGPSEEEKEFLPEFQPIEPTETDTLAQEEAVEPEISVPEAAIQEQAEVLEQTAPEPGGETPKPAETAESAPTEVMSHEESDFFLANVMSASPVNTGESTERPESGEMPSPTSASSAPENAETSPRQAVQPSASAEPARREEKKTTATNARASVYVSPALATPGEWVGEPMPIGTPVSCREKAEAAGAETRTQEASRTASQRPLSRGQGQSFQSGYTSPSVPVPGEWVGEPMPILRKQPEESAQPDPKAEDKGEPIKAASAAMESAASAFAESAGAAVAVEPASASAGSNSLMDFIVSASRVEEPAVAGPPEEPQEKQQEKPQEKASGGMTDFVEKSLSLVSSAISSAFAATHPEGRVSMADESAKPERAATSPNDAASSDAIILALVQRLDVAMAEANSAHAAGRTLMVAKAAASIAEESENFGFRVLARMARCVERAGRAGDMNALRDLLPELAVSVERNRIALTQRK